MASTTEVRIDYSFLRFLGTTAKDPSSFDGLDDVSTLTEQLVIPILTLSYITP